ncbi:MAG: putative glycoside hydrolase [Kocuria sp.]|nr:putative glycoside hydrolase [Kocuria sp.]
MTGVGAWIRYKDPIEPYEVDFAVEHYRAAILQPWELEVAAELKQRRPDMTVLCYKCLSSTRAYEPGPIYTSGVSFAEAEAEGGRWFATRQDGSRIQWQRYAQHWQMKVWDSTYRQRWVQNVVAELADSPFDGVMADNDVFDDYYGLNLPLSDLDSLSDLRAALGELVAAAGQGLQEHDKILVPNIAESRRTEGRWAEHSQWGGGFEEVWLGWDPNRLFDHWTVAMQLQQLNHPGVGIFRVPTDGTDEHPNFLYGLAAFWVFGEGKGAYSATGHDDYGQLQYIPELDFLLGEPVGLPVRHGQAWWREFTDGFAAVNFGQDRTSRCHIKIPGGMVDGSGKPAPRKCVLYPQQGLVVRRDGAS